MCPPYEKCEHNRSILTCPKCQHLQIEAREAEVKRKSNNLDTQLTIPKWKL